MADSQDIPSHHSPVITTQPSTSGWALPMILKMTDIILPPPHIMASDSIVSFLPVPNFPASQASTVTVPVMPAHAHYPSSTWPAHTSIMLMPLSTRGPTPTRCINDEYIFRVSDHTCNVIGKRVSFLLRPLTSRKHLSCMHKPVAPYINATWMQNFMQSMCQQSMSQMYPGTVFQPSLSSPTLMPDTTLHLHQRLPHTRRQ